MKMTTERRRRRRKRRRRQMRKDMMMNVRLRGPRISPLPSILANVTCHTLLVNPVSQKLRSPRPKMQFAVTFD